MGVDAELKTRRSSGARSSGFKSEKRRCERIKVRLLIGVTGWTAQYGEEVETGVASGSGWWSLWMKDGKLSATGF